MADNEEDVSVEGMQANLALYKEQLQNVKGLLAADPGNAEYQELARSLQEVIELTHDVLSSTQLSEAERPEACQAGDISDSHAEDSEVKFTDNQIAGRLPVGSKVQAVWSEDGEWYDGTVEAITMQGYLVSYDGWGNKEEVDIANVREIKTGEDVGITETDAMLEAEREAEETRLAIKRKIAQAAEMGVLHREMPSKLRILPDDPEEIKAAKKKKIHAFKSKFRLEQIEVMQNKRQNAWQQFQTTKGKSKKVGFFTGRKRESIFKSPDDPKGKVGVTGSGKGITEFQKREKHFHTREGNDEEE